MVATLLSGGNYYGGNYCDAIIMVAILLGGGNPTDVDSLPPFGSDGGYFSTYFCDIFDIYYFSTYFSDNFDIYDILQF